MDFREGYPGKRRGPGIRNMADGRRMAASYRRQFALRARGPRRKVLLHREDGRVLLECGHQAWRNSSHDQCRLCPSCPSNVNFQRATPACIADFKAGVIIPNGLELERQLIARPPEAPANGSREGAPTQRRADVA